MLAIRAQGMGKSDGNITVIWDKCAVPSTGRPDSPCIYDASSHGVCGTRWHIESLVPAPLPQESFLSSTLQKRTLLNKICLGILQSIAAHKK
jgi:hypothetical protein